MDRCEKTDLENLADAFFENLEISRSEYGGIGLDPKRPFGNSDVESDMLEILEIDVDDDNEEEMRLYVESLYREKLIPYLRESWKKNKLDAQKDMEIDMLAKKLEEAGAEVRKIQTDRGTIINLAPPSEKYLSVIEDFASKNAWKISFGP